MKRKVCFILEASKQGGDRGRQARVQRSLPTDNQWAEAFKGEFQGCTGGGRGLHAETAQSALTAILKLVIGGLTRVILIVLSPVSLRFQGQLVPISLRPVLGIVAAYVLGTVWPFCS